VDPGGGWMTAGAKAGHHPSSWYKFGGSGLPVHHFEVWRRDQRDPVFVYGRVGDVKQCRMMQSLIVRHKIVPADVQDASLAP